MRRRSERQQDFETLKQTLYAAGLSTVKAAKAQEDMLTTTLEALTDAYEAQAMPQLDGASMDPDLQPIFEVLLAERKQALSQGNYAGYVDAETKLQHLDELRVTRLERQVRELIAQQRLDTLTQPTPDPWTEEHLKAQYSTLGAVRKAFSIKVRSWQEAVHILNQDKG